VARKSPLCASYSGSALQQRSIPILACMRDAVHARGTLLRPLSQFQISTAETFSEDPYALVSLTTQGAVQTQCLIFRRATIFSGWGEPGPRGSLRNGGLRPNAAQQNAFGWQTGALAEGRDGKLCHCHYNRYRPARGRETGRHQVFSEKSPTGRRNIPRWSGAHDIQAAIKQWPKPAARYRASNRDTRSGSYV
jgi:hypothetical protein